MSTGVGPDVRQASSHADDPHEAIAEVAAGLDAADASVVFLFCSARHDRNALGRAIARAFAGRPVVGCTTAGELSGATGYVAGSVTGASIRSPRLRVATRLIGPLDGFDATWSTETVQTLVDEVATDGLDPERQFALLLIDGLSMQEEAVAATLHGSLHGVGLFGGSAGDEMRFEGTAVYHDGAFHEGAAVVAMFDSGHPFHLFRFQHFEPTDIRMVTTAADPASRTVHEIDGMPAAEAYARAVGVDPAELDGHVFARHPVMLRVGGEWYVRSIQQALPDGSLTFYCAIDDGLVLALGRGVDLARSIRESFDRLRETHGEPGFLLACDCIFRRLELTDLDALEAGSASLRGLPLIGFNTYGEQFRGLHVNQTLTGVMLGTDER
ncbi:FIST N-terminal domain-containing protein [Thioalkalivibrio sp. ALR17-21]|uniref:FIST N-terminal domain-containing protein n=1 Tax=Thioalkalivibrio sp. ALR17-21 TaxID=1269813 RepID=UPI00041BFDC4|nr:FIST N-terminal domain-containing protein [Thioalkalivibrio sp. ALR17-21]